MDKTIICDLGRYCGNRLYIKRDDLIPFSFGGNKARKAALFFAEIDAGNYDCVVTYGSGSSNHCRVVANMCCQRGLACRIISPLEASGATCNSAMIKLFGAEVTTVPVSEVHDTIEAVISELRQKGHSPYFIGGGGHGSTGTRAYVECYDEIKEYETENHMSFDYIFFASGTGTTQAGLVCGKLLHGDNTRIVGISIARKNPRGRDIVLDSIRTYMGGEYDDIAAQNATIFIDDYTDGYGKDDERIRAAVEKVLKNYGIPLDTTYTGKAFSGMEQYLEKHNIRNNRVLFIHTGGTPLFFDYLNKR